MGCTLPLSPPQGRWLRSLAICTLASNLLCAAAEFPPRSLPIFAGVNDPATLAPSLKVSEIADQWRNEAYGLILRTNGEIAALHLGESTPVLSSNVWYLQGQGQDAAGKPTFVHLDTPEHIAAPIDVTVDAQGNRVYEIQSVVQGYLVWSQRMVCMPQSLRVELTYTPLKELTPGIQPNLFTRLRVSGEVLQSFSQPNNNPINLVFEKGSVEVRFPSEFSWHKGYWVDGRLIVFSPLALSPWVVGKPIKLWYQLDFRNFPVGRAAP